MYSPITNPCVQVDMDKAFSDAVERFASRPDSHSFCHYIIRDNVIHRRCYGTHVGYKMFPDKIFSFLSRSGQKFRFVLRRNTVG